MLRGMTGSQSQQKVSSLLRAHVYQLADTIGERNVYHPAALHAAEDYIRESWEAMGFDVGSQEYEVRGIRCANLEVTVTGRERVGEILLVGAHYDTVYGSPGANDNGSGVAGMLELSRLLVQSRPCRSLRFVAFVNEEPPFFFTANQGSRQYAGEARRRGNDIRLMLSLETIGYYRDEAKSQSYPPLFRYFFPDRANFIAFVSNFRSRPQLRKLARAFRQSGEVPEEHVATFAWIPGVAWSDHLSFWRHGYPGVMVTDTAFYRYPWYHSPEDTAEKLDYDRLAAVILGLHGALLQLDSMDL